MMTLPTVPSVTSVDEVTLKIKVLDREEGDGEERFQFLLLFFVVVLFDV